MKAKYALKAMLHLARRQDAGPVLIAELAKDENIPKKFLEAILLELRNRGILQSRKGKGGGYMLARSPESLSVGHIIEVFDGPMMAPVCVTHSVVLNCNMCDQAPQCGLRLIMEQVRQAVTGCLGNMKLTDVLSKTQAISDDGAGTFNI
jgi:Rrf2 family protein